MNDLPAAEARWRISVDTGGTFTDCLAADPGGRVLEAKVLSSGGLRARAVAVAGPRSLRLDHGWTVGDGFLVGFRLRWLDANEDYEVLAHDAATATVDLARDLADAATMRLPRACQLSCDEPAPVLAARLVTGAPPATPLPELAMRLGTTRGTNALLERGGAPTALFITAGFADLPEIGDQQRPDLFALNIVKRRLLHRSVIEVNERIAADGGVLVELDDAELDRVERAARDLAAGGVRSAAVACMNAYRNPTHERRLVERLGRVGFEHVVSSTAISPRIKIVPRSETAIVDAYLGPVVRGYLTEVGAAVGEERLHVMSSAGGLARATRFRASESLLSGPAAGVAGAAAAGRRSGFRRIIGFDMGGTSTDVARYDDDFEYRFEQTVGDARLQTPALAIETVAAGGGSICRFADDRLAVGPESAGADPGPACYGAGGPLTITDVNLLVGRLDPSHFEIPIDRAPAQAALDDVLDDMRAAGATPGRDPDPDEVLAGFLQIANERMASAIEQISLARGYDPREHAMVAFGGAGGQHACDVAGHLGIDTVVMPARASLLSAVGLAEAVVERFAVRQVLEPLDAVVERLPGWFDELSRRAIDEVRDEEPGAEAIRVRRRMAYLRLIGQDSTIEIEFDDGLDLADAFATSYEAIYRHRPRDRAIEVESIRAIASTVAAEAAEAGGEAAPPEPHAATPIEGGAGRFDRRELRPGATFDGPALVLDRHSTYVIGDGWRGRIDAAGAIVATRDGRAVPAVGRGGEAVELELFTNRFRSIVEESGRMMERTALSTNVKERLDFSCALLDGAGRLVVNAPHMPVHLGAMGLCVREVARVVPMRDGDVVVTNHPGYGGSHLPDITVITPVFTSPDASRPLGYLANRAHHAEIGGARPGSMPPTASTLVEEGVVIPPMHLVDAGQSRYDTIEALLSGAPYPSRLVSDNLADLQAAVAANHRGLETLQTLARRFGDEVVATQMKRITAAAERRIRDALAALPDATYAAVEHLDDGAAIAVAIKVEGDHAIVDFTGSSPVHGGNLNATPAIVHSAVLYVMRLLTGRPGPLNDGIMAAIEVVLPPGMLNPDFGDDPATAPAVVGGNVETSQRIVDTLLKALKLCAGSQGTMNNTLFGNERTTYYETVCGGAGAGPGFDGAHAVHTHMTNTRLTDPEILEHRYPVRLERFAVRRGSGGAGRHRGGDGVIREMRFLEPVSLSILSQHRRERPFGMEGGAPGACGCQRVERGDGTVVSLDSVDGCDMCPGDRFVLETPGGGGWGPLPFC